MNCIGINALEVSSKDWRVFERSMLGARVVNRDGFKNNLAGSVETVAPLSQCV